MSARSLSLPARLWFRGRYYLSGLILILPLVAFPHYFRQAGTPPLGAHVLPERQVGPYAVTLAEQRLGPPRPGPEGALLKDYQLRIREGYPDRVRSVYIRLGPPEGDDLGDIMHGNPYRLHAHVEFDRPPRADDFVWLTLEEWDGTLHQASWPIAEAVTKASFLPPQGK